MNNESTYEKALASNSLALLDELKNNGYAFSTVNLIEAVSNHADASVLNFLLMNGVDINQQDKNGVTALEQTIKSADVETAKILISLGASISRRHLMIALHEESLLFVRLLVENGAKIPNNILEGWLLFLTFAPKQ